MTGAESIQGQDRAPDRLAEIKENCSFLRHAFSLNGAPRESPTLDYSEWLIADVERLRFFIDGLHHEVDAQRTEIERLRKIEDAAITACEDGGGDVIDLERVVQANPRPETADG